MSVVTLAGAIKGICTDGGLSRFIHSVTFFFRFTHNEGVQYSKVRDACSALRDIYIKCNQISIQCLKCWTRQLCPFLHSNLSPGGCKVSAHGCEIYVYLYSSIVE